MEEPTLPEWRKSSFSNPSGNCLQVRNFGSGGVQVRNGTEPGVVCSFTPAEWTAFVAGVKAGEFG